MMEPARAPMRAPFQICGGIPFVNCNFHETGHAVSNRFRQARAAADGDFVATPQRRLPASLNLVAA